MTKSGLSREALISEASDLCARAARASAEGASLRVRVYLEGAAAILDRARPPDGDRLDAAPCDELSAGASPGPSSPSRHSS